MAYYTHRSWKPLLLYLGLMFCPHYSQSPSTLTNSTCWAGCCSSPAVQLTGSSEADFIFVNDRCVNVHLCLDLCNHRLFGFFWLFVCLSPHFSCIRVVCDVVSWSRQLSLLCFCPPPPSPPLQMRYKNILPNLVSLLPVLLFSTSSFCTLSHLLHGERMALMNCM